MSVAVTSPSDFAPRLYQRLATALRGQNLFLSPFSVHVALAMCAAGAKGETRKVLAALLRLPANADEQNRQYSSWVKSMCPEDEGVQLTMANALWAQQGLHLKNDYQQAITKFYDGTFQQVDFLAAPAEAVKTINGWVSDKTAGNIRDLLQQSHIDRATRLILTNAIYFKGKWETQFDKADTDDQDWHGPTSTRKVPMMHQSHGFQYYEDDACQAVDLPYQGDQLSMLVVLPRDNAGLASLESSWNENNLYALVTNGLVMAQTVNLSLPRFTMQGKYDLKPELRALGAELPFSGAADFSGMADEPLMISEVVHQAFVEVNEEGTEAAAATGVAMTKCAYVEPAEPKVFQADHPFLFFIRDRTTDTVLFAGRLFEPM